MALLITHVASYLLHNQKIQLLRGKLFYIIHDFVTLTLQLGYYCTAQIVKYHIEGTYLIL
jgi:hypothetical protein